jgi:hypothetical protein
MIIDFRNEIWKYYKGENWSDDDEFMVSNYGRIKKKKKYEENWRISPTSIVSNYLSFGIRKKTKKRTKGLQLMYTG